MEEGRIRISGLGGREKIFPYFIKERLDPFSESEQNQSFMCSTGVGLFIAHLLIAMLTTKEVLEELRRMGVKDRISLRAYLKDFDDYMMTHYGIKILDRKKKLPVLPAQK